MSFVPAEGMVSYKWGFVPPPGQTRGCRDSCLGGTLVPTASVAGLTLVVLTLMSGKLLSSFWRFELSPTSKKVAHSEYVKSMGLDKAALLPSSHEKDEKDYVRHQAALSMVGIPFWLVMGPCCGYLCILFEMTYSYNDPRNFQNDISLMTEKDLHIHNLACFAGELFLGYIMYQNVMFALGWDRGLDTLVHHTSFLLLSWIQLSYSVFVKVGLWAVSMELSTPALFVFLVSRQVDGDRAKTLAGWSSKVFAVIFFITRVIGYGYGIVTCIVATVAHFDVVLPADKPDAIPREKGLFLLLLLIAGWALQLYWSTFIFAKLFQKNKPRKTDEAGAYGGVDAAKV